MNELLIVMPFIGALEYTKQAIESIKSSHIWGLFLADNRGDVDIEKYFNENVPKSPLSPTIYIKGAKTLAESWNLGISFARKNDFKYILISNNDLLFHSKTIDNLIYFIDNTDYGMVTAKNINDGILTESEFQNLNPKQFDEKDLNPITKWLEEGPDFSCFLIKPDLMDKVGYFDEAYFPAYFEDNDMDYRMHVTGIKARRISTAPYFHYGSKTLQLNPDIKDKLDADKCFENNRNYFMDKWGANYPECIIEGNGFKTPFNSGMSIKHWNGSKKYEQNSILAQ